MGEQKPETKHWLREDVEDCVGNNFGVESNESATISDAPDATERQYVKRVAKKLSD